MANNEMKFGVALEQLKDGHPISRRSWLNKNRYLIINPGIFNFKAAAEEAGDLGTFLEIDAEPKLCSVFGVRPDLFRNEELAHNLMPTIQHVLAHRNISAPYFATHEDMLAEDWFIV